MTTATARLVATSAVAIALIACVSARADTLWISSTGGAALQVNNVKIVDVQGDNIIFRGLGGGESSRPLASIVRMTVDDEPALTAAEEAFRGGQWDTAIENYLRAMKTTLQPWAKRYSAQRLMTAAEQAGRFEPAVTAYVTLVQEFPDLARKPVFGAQGPETLNAAVGNVQTAMKYRNLTPEQNRLFLSFLVDLHRARGDQKAASETIDQLLKVGALDANDPAMARQLARLLIDQAAVALDSGQPQKAIDVINAQRQIFTDPHEQADALWYLAEAQHALAAQQSDPQTALKDAAIAYVRIVTHFKDLPDRPRVPDALLRVAQIHEKLNDPETALDLYEQTANQYNDTPAGPRARQEAERIRAARADG